MDKSAGNQQLQFTAEIWANDTKLLPSAKKDKFQIRENDKFPFLDIKMIWSLKGGMQFGVFREKEQQFKYIRKVSTHAPGTLCAIPSGFQNRLANPTSQKPYFIWKGGQYIPRLCKRPLRGGSSTYNFLYNGRTMQRSKLKRILRLKISWSKKKDKQKCLSLCLILKLFLYIYLQGTPVTHDL